MPDLDYTSLGQESKRRALPAGLGWGRTRSSSQAGVPEDMSAVRLFLLVLMTATLCVVRAGAESRSPTPDQKERLDQFGYDVFQTSLPGLIDQSGKVSQRMLVDRFGQPVRRASALGRYGDRRSGESTAIHWTTWYFPGLAFAMSQVPAQHNGARKANLIVVGVSVTSPSYILRNGLRVGEARSRFLQVLGPPTYQDRKRLRYDVENAARIAPDEFEIQPYQIDMDLDAHDRVRRIVWSWWSD